MSLRPHVMAIATLAVGLAGCRGDRPGNIPTPPEAYVDAESVMRRIKADLRDYLIYQASIQQAAPLPNACSGAVSFRIKSVTVTLNVVTQVTTGGEVSAKVPIGGFELGPNLSSSGTQKASQKITFTLEPKTEDVDRAAPIPRPEPGSFYSALRGLRESLLKASGERPCFSFPKEQKNSVETAFQVIRSDTAKFGITFLIFSVGANSSRSLDGTNTIAVAFEGQGIFLRDPVTGKLRQVDAQLQGRLPPGAVVAFPDEIGDALDAAPERPAAPPPRPRR